MADPFQDLFTQNVVRDPQTGRYFLPFGNTVAGQQFARTGSGFVGDGGTVNVAGQNDEPNRDVPTGSSYSSLNDYFNALDPWKGFSVLPQGVPSWQAQNSLGLSNIGTAEGSTDRLSRGTYNDQPGYYFDPNYLTGGHPATTSGGKPNDTGLWQVLSLLAPAVGAATGLWGTAAGNVGSSAFEGSVPAAAGTAESATGSIVGNEATNTLTGNTVGDTSLDFSNYDSSDYRMDNPGEFTAPPSGTDSLWDTLKQYYGDAKTALSAYNTITGGGRTGGAGGSLLGAGLGALLGSAGGSKPAGTTTSIQDIPDWQKQLLIPALQQSQGLLAQQQNYGFPLLGPAQDQMGKTISGDYLNPASNPYLRDTYDQAARAVTDNYSSTVQPRNDAMFYKAGAFGPSNSAYDETVARNQFGLGQNLKNLATDIYGGNYSRERQNQLTATSAAPDYSSALLGAQWAPYKNFMGVAGGGFGNTNTQPYFTNKLGNVFGGALLGSQLLG